MWSDKIAVLCRSIRLWDELRRTCACSCIVLRGDLQSRLTPFTVNALQLRHAPLSRKLESTPTFGLDPDGLVALAGLRRRLPANGGLIARAMHYGLPECHARLFNDSSCLCSTASLYIATLSFLKRMTV